jgi:hypothetical protein
LAQKKHGSTHHVIPKSRGGPKESWNLMDKIIKEHRAWHLFFYNLLPCEAIAKILGTHKKNLISTTKQIKAWQVLFGNDASSQEAIEAIKNGWTLRWCFTFKQCCDDSTRKKQCPILELYEKGGLKW